MKTPVFSYQKKNTLVHNAPASVKLAVQFLLCFFLFLRTGSEKAEITVLAFCTAVIAAAFILARLRFQDLGKLSFVLCIGGLYAVFKIFRLDFSGTEDGQFRLPAGTQEGIPLLFGIIEVHREEVRSAFLYAFRFFMSALAALIFFHTTPPVEIKFTLEALQEQAGKIFPFARRFIRKRNPALLLTLAIHFIPAVFQTWSRIDRAAKARLPRRKRRCIAPTRLYGELTALLSCMIQQAENKRKAIVNRSAREETQE